MGKRPAGGTDRARRPGRPRRSDGWRISSTARGYYAEEYRGGKRVNRVSLGTRDQAEAQRAFADLTTAASRPGGALTLDGIMAHYIRERGREGKDTRRMEQARQYLESLMVYQPSQVNRRLIRDYTDARRAAGVSTGAIRTDLAYLSAALHLAKKDDLIDKAPSIPLPPAGRPREAYIRRDMAPAFLAAIVAEHARLFAILALATAARPSHILGLTWDRVDFERRTISFDDPDVVASNKRRPIVPMNDMAMQALVPAHALRVCDYVIEIGGRPIKDVGRAIERAGERVGLKVTPYVLRHTAGVWMAEDGVPMAEIAQYMGHTTIATTMTHYARFSPEYLQGAARSLNVQPSRLLK